MCEIASIMDPDDAGRLLRKPLLSLVRDTSPTVRAALLPSLGPVLAVSVGVLKCMWKLQRNYALLTYLSCHFP
jgi:hypothetical protein